MLSHGNYKSQQPLAVYSSKRRKTLPSYYCHWTASLDRRGIEWRDDGRVTEMLGAFFRLSTVRTWNSHPLQALCSCCAGP